jgi:hypothetical protein
MSANDLLRVFLSELDAAAGTLCNLFENISMARSAAQLEKTIAKLLDLTSGKPPGILYVTGWSPEAVSAFFLEHHDLVLSYFRKEEGCTITKFWENCGRMPQLLRFKLN